MYNEQEVGLRLELTEREPDPNRKTSLRVVKAGAGSRKRGKGERGSSHLFFNCKVRGETIQHRTVSGT